jgi:hypothetical protein
MASPGSIVIQFRADADKARRNINKLTKSLDGVGRQAKDTGGKLSKFAKAGPLAVAAGLGAAAFAAVDFAKAAYSDAQAAAKLERQLLRVAGVTDANVEAAGKWIDTMELMTGIADDDLRQALGRLAVVTGDVAEAQSLTTLAADASVASGKEFKTVFNAMAKAAGGNTSALKRLFPELDAGPDKVLTLAEAVGQLEDKYKDAAKAAEDNDLFGRLATIWGQVKEALGQAALPTLEALAAWFADPANIAALQAWVTKLGDWSRTVGEDFAGKVQTFIDYLQSPAGKAQVDDMATSLLGIADALGDIVETAEKAGPVIDFLRAIQGDVISTDAGNDVLERERARRQAPMNRLDAKAKAKAAASGDTYVKGGPGSVNVYVTAPKPMSPEDSAALAIRLAKVTTNTGR